MKVNKHKAAIIGLAASTLFSTTGCACTFGPGNNEPTTVYGPPEYFGMDQDQDDDNTDPVNEQHEIDPSDNMIEDVYGPPEDF